MSDDERGLTLYRLHRLTTLEPDMTRSLHTRERCRTAMRKRQSRDDAAIGARRVGTLALESGVTVGLSAGYLVAVIHDLVRLYTSR